MRKINNVEQARALSWDDKMKVWNHYMLNQVYLNNVPIYTNISDRSYEEPNMFNKSYKPNYDKIYPTLKIGLWYSSHKIRIKSFKEFCQGNDDRVPESLVGYYWRFKDEIFKDV